MPNHQSFSERFLMEINNIYIVYREEYPFSLEEVREISRAVHSGSYVFSPLRLVALPKERANDHFIHKSSIPDLPEIAFVCIPSSKDALVLMTLALF